jgi:alkylation response protein AidB-like acyl-CoA dehydrogenase
MADFGGSELEGFRAEARTWLEANFPASLAHKPELILEAMNRREKPTGDVELWRQRMGEKGWGVPTWPAHLGGGGLSQAEARVLGEEMARIGAANPIGGMGVVMFGPTLLEYGNDEQLNRHVPPIVKAELRWCQGYSEPGAGSDLASLQTRAEDKGDHFLVNGQKIWTSGAHLADWCFCLVRTDPKAKKHEGISFLLIDMKSPGVEPRPIRLINDTTPFCETFFTDGARPGGLPGAPLPEMARAYVGLDDSGRLADADLRSRLTQHLMEAKAFTLTGQRAAQENRSNRGPSTTSSVLKNVGSKVRVDAAELGVEILGHQGLGWGGDDFTPDEVGVVSVWLRGKAGTIAGGSYEVQNNIISKRILGLPDPMSATQASAR